LESEDQALLIKKLRWRCRRGMKEMDLLLEQYLLKQASLDGIEAFQNLLDTEDDQLWRWLAGIEPPSPDCAVTVQRVRSFASHLHQIQSLA
jgi:antitoxin CptB